jgi:hypothetical protein
VRFLLPLLLLLAACARGPSPTEAASGCERRAEATIAFTAPDAADQIVARALGESCEAAVVVWSLQEAGTGIVLWAYAAPYEVLATTQDVASTAEMSAFLDRWVKSPVDDTGASPAWGDSETVPEDWGPSGHTAFMRETYESIRAARHRRLCVRTTRERFVCLFHDPRVGAVDIHFEGGL